MTSLYKKKQQLALVSYSHNIDRAQTFDSPALKGLTAKLQNYRAYYCEGNLCLS